jgi:hypothetical protein
MINFDIGCSAILMDSTCGSVSFCNHAGELVTFNLDVDPEFILSGLEEPCGDSYDTVYD